MSRSGGLLPLALKCRQFNTVLNDGEILERIEEERIAEAADRYERGKNGTLR